MKYLLATFLFSFFILFFNYEIQSREVENHYSILNVKKDANDKEIRSAFKKLTLLYHPDKNKENKEAAKKNFYKITTAYEILSDPVKRKQYDNKLNRKNSEQEYNYGFEDNDDNEYDEDYEPNPFSGFDFQDVFDSFFDSFNEGQKKPNNKQKKKKKEEIIIDRDDIFENTEVFTITINNISKFYNRKESWIILLMEVDSIDEIYTPELESLIELFINLSNLSKIKTNHNIIKVAAVDCDYEKEICEELFLQGENQVDNDYMYLPQIIYFTKNIAELYLGKREIESLISFLSSKMPNFVRFLDANDYDDIINLEENISKIIYLDSNVKEYDDLNTIVLNHLSKSIFKDKYNFYKTQDMKLINKYLNIKEQDLPMLISINKPIQFEYTIIANNLKLKEISYSELLKEITATRFKNKQSIKNKISKIYEFVPSNQSKSTKYCMCHEKKINTICVLLINAKDSKKSKNTISEAKKNFLNNLIKYNNFRLTGLSIKFCYINEGNLSELISIYSINKDKHKLLNEANLILTYFTGNLIEIYSKIILNFIQTITKIDDFLLKIEKINRSKPNKETIKDDL